MRATTLAVTIVNAISVAWSNRLRCIRYLTSFYNMHKEGTRRRVRKYTLFVYKRDKHIEEVVTICMNRCIVQHALFWQPRNPFFASFDAIQLFFVQIMYFVK